MSGEKKRDLLFLMTTHPPYTCRKGLTEIYFKRIVYSLSSETLVNKRRTVGRFCYDLRSLPISNLSFSCILWSKVKSTRPQFPVHDLSLLKETVQLFPNLSSLSVPTLEPEILLKTKFCGHFESLIFHTTEHGH